MARGSIFRRHGGYAIRADLGPDPATDKRRQHYKQGFRTKREAEAALDELLSSVRSGDVFNQASTTLGQFLDDWLVGQNQRLKETTRNSYSVAVERIRNGLGKRKLQALMPLEIERFYLRLAETGGRTGRPLVAKTISNIHVVLRKALDDAERLGLVQRNAAAVARPPVAHRTEQQTWSADNLRAFFATLPTIVCMSSTCCWPPPGCAGEKRWACGGRIWTLSTGSSPWSTRSPR